MKDEDIKGLPITWVNTPLSYAKLTTQYNLFQQSVLLKVSEVLLQRQMEIYYGSDLKDNPDVPRPLFTEEQKRAGLGKIYVSYAELGVAASSFPKVREEAQKCLRDMMVAGPVILKEGKPTQSFFPVFTEVHVDHSNSTCSFELNTALIFPDKKDSESVIDYTFDMSQRYVKHPDNIAIVGKVEKMPGLYFLLRDTMQAWKFKKAKLTVSQIKEFLNLYKTNEKTGIREPRYPKFSQFRNHVLEPALADIQRLKDIGQIDVSFTMDVIYKGKRKVGDPECIIFSVVNDKPKKQDKVIPISPEDIRKASEKHLCETLLEQYPTLDAARLITIIQSIPSDLWEDFKQYAYNGVSAAVERPHRWNGTHEDFVFYIMEQWINQRKPKSEPIRQDLFTQPQNLKTSEPHNLGYAEWQIFLATYDGALAEYVKDLPFYKFEDGKVVTDPSPEQHERLEAAIKNATPQDRQIFVATLVKAFGRPVKWMYK